MADPTIRVKRSTVQGKTPTNEQLGLGEIAINHYDGKVFIRQDTAGVGIGTTVIEVGREEWVRITTTYTTTSNKNIIADTSGGAYTITLPASPSEGDIIRFADGDDWSTNNLTVARNGNTIEGSADDLILDVSTLVTLIYDSSTWHVYSQVGPEGPQGTQGYQGDTGAQGNQGNQGNQGYQGDTGAQGNQGYQGDTGAQGNQGNQGYQGDTGAQGNQGNQGNQGYQGDTGAQGNQGNQGNQGFQGAAGPSNILNSSAVTTNDTFYPVFVSGIGNQTPSIRTAATAFTFNPSTGTLTATDFNSSSDIKLKNNIQTFENALEIIQEIRGVRFDWKENQKPSVGVVAQEVEKVLPELVTDTDPKTVNYNGIIGVLIESIKEQQELIKNQNERIDNLELLLKNK